MKHGMLVCICLVIMLAACAPAPTSVSTATPLPTATALPTALVTPLPTPTALPTPSPIPTPTPISTIVSTPTAEAPKWVEQVNLTKNRPLSIDNSSNETGWNNKKVALIKMSDQLDMQIGLGEIGYGGGIYFINTTANAGLYLGIEKSGNKSGFFVEFKSQGKQVRVNHLPVPTGREFRLQIKNNGKIIVIYPTDSNKPLIEIDTTSLSPDFQNGLFPDSILDGRLSVAPKSKTTINKLVILKSPSQQIVAELLPVDIYPHLPSTGIPIDNLAHPASTPPDARRVDEPTYNGGKSTYGWMQNATVDEVGNLKITMVVDAKTNPDQPITKDFIIPNNKNFGIFVNVFSEGVPKGYRSKTELVFQTMSAQEAADAIMYYQQELIKRGIKNMIINLQYDFTDPSGDGWGNANRMAISFS